MLKIKQTFNLKLSGRYALRSTGYIALVLVAPGRYLFKTSFMQEIYAIVYHVVY